MVAMQVQDRFKARPEHQPMVLSLISEALGGAGPLQNWRSACFITAEAGPGLKWDLGPTGRLRVQGGKADIWIVIFLPFQIIVNTVIDNRFTWIY